VYTSKETPDVQRLTRANFNSFASKKSRGNRVVVLHLYSPSAQGVSILAPALQEFAKTLKGAVSVGAVDCGVDAGVCKSVGVAGGGANSIKVLHGGGTEEVHGLGGFMEALQRGQAPLKVLSRLWDTVAGYVPSRVGTLGGSRSALDKLARKCVSAGGGERRGTVACVVLFSAHAKVSPMFAALSSSTAFDATQKSPVVAPATARGGGGSSPEPADEPPPAFVFAQVEVPSSKDSGGGGGSATSKGARVSVQEGKEEALGAADLGVKELPSLLLLIGSSLEEWRLGAPLREGELMNTDVKGRLFAPKAALTNTHTMNQWLSAQQKSLAKGRRSNK